LLHDMMNSEKDERYAELLREMEAAYGTELPFVQAKLHLEDQPKARR